LLSNLMPIPAFFFSRILARLFVLSIVILAIGCATHNPAPVVDKSYARVNRPQTHVVIPGDTLFSIAWRYGLKYEALAEYNGIKPPYIIRPSQIIRLDLNPSRAAPSTPVKPVGGNQKPAAAVKTKPVQKSQPVAASKIKQTPVAKTNQQNTAPAGAPQWRWPAAGPLLSTFQSNGGLNKGIDIGGKLGEPVLAAAAGKVVYSGSGLRGYGKLLIVKHNETFLSAYAHNDVLRVKEGEVVKVGQVIAEMGSSGTDRVKLHFEIRKDGTPVDPMKFLPRR
jgi:lipoprotein NlpD